MIECWMIHLSVSFFKKKTTLTCLYFSRKRHIYNNQHSYLFNEYMFLRSGPFRFTNKINLLGKNLYVYIYIYIVFVDRILDKIYCFLKTACIFLLMNTCFSAQVRSWGKNPYVYIYININFTDRILDLIYCFLKTACIFLKKTHIWSTFPFI